MATDPTPGSAASIPYEGTDCTAEEAVEAVKAVRGAARARRRRRRAKWMRADFKRAFSPLYWRQDFGPFGWYYRERRRRSGNY